VPVVRLKGSGTGWDGLTGTGAMDDGWMDGWGAGEITLMLNGVVSWIDSGGLVSRLSLGLGWMVSRGISSHRLRGAPFGWAAIGWEDSRGDMSRRPCIATLSKRNGG
jgi:hypothetical protein